MKVCKICLILSGLFLINFNVVSQAQNQENNQSTQSTIKMPTMPSLSSPTVGGEFYRPGSSGFYSGVKRNEKKSSQTQNTQSTTTDQTNTNNQTPNVQDIKNYQDLTAISNKLTANDLIGLDNMGLLGNFSGLLTNNSKMNSDTIALQKILQELGELKTKVGQSSIEQARTTSQTRSINPKIIRLNINGIELASSCRQVYFSTQESDGSFLFSADRRYFINNTTRSETFYLLFKATGNSSGITTYSVVPEILQDLKDETSPIYKICQKNNITATRTGNLVKLTSSDGDLRYNILLSLD